MIRRHPACIEELIPLRYLARGQLAEIGELIEQIDGAEVRWLELHEALELLPETN